PKILVLDEPTAAIDPAGSRDIQNLIVSLKERGTTILLSSHLLTQVQEVCDRVGILHRGKLLREGHLEDLLAIENQTEFIVDNALGAINFFLSMLAIVATAQLLPRDLEDRVIYSVLAKPVRRFEYMLGKFFGVLGLLVISLVAMSILCLAVIHLREEAAVRETMQQLSQSPSEELDHALVGVHQAG